MSLLAKKVTSVLIIGLTVLGIIVSIYLIFQVWRVRQPVIEKLQAGTDQASTVLQTTDEGLVVINLVVKNVYTSTLYLNESTLAISQTVQSTSQFMDTASTFVGDNLITTITNTQSALGAAQASAQVIDNILSTLARVPLIGIPYNPSVPLSKALGDVSSSLDPLQSTLKSFETDLHSTRTNMQVFSGQISVLNKNILEIQQNLNQAEVTIEKYRLQINDLQTSLENAKSRLPVWVTTSAWLITLLIVWMIIIQVSILLQSISQLSEKRARVDEPKQQN